MLYHTRRDIERVPRRQRELLHTREPEHIKSILRTDLYKKCRDSGEILRAAGVYSVSVKLCAV